MKEVLFVCTANVCRSPMAETIFNALAKDRGLDFRAQSAGVKALRDKSRSPNASSVLEEIGFRAESHRARQVTEKMLEEADLVLAMGPRHVAELRRVFGSSFEIHTLPSYANDASDDEGVPDPYGSTMTAYRASARQLLEYVNLLLDRLEK